MVNSVAIVKTSSLGDIIQAFVGLHYLKNRFPSIHVTWIAERPAETLLRSHPLIDQVHTIDTQAWRKNCITYFQKVREFKKSICPVDLVFDLQGNCKSALITACIPAKIKVGFGWHSVAEKPNILCTNRHIEISKALHASKRYLHLIGQYFQDKDPEISSTVALRISNEEQLFLSKILSSDALQHRPKWLIAPGSIWRNKQLPDAIWTEFIAYYKDPVFILVFRGEEEKKRALFLKQLAPERVLLVGEVSLPFIQALMRNMDLVISADSALLHLSATTHIPSFSFFGPSSSAVYKPFGEHNRCFQGSCPYNETFLMRCSKLRTCPTGACLRSVSFNEVFNNLKR